MMCCLIALVLLRFSSCLCSFVRCACISYFISCVCSVLALIDCSFVVVELLLVDVDCVAFVRLLLYIVFNTCMMCCAVALVVLLLSCCLCLSLLCLSAGLLCVCWLL